jgi:hypothetical protein
MAVFINYRREDSEGETRALYNRLAKETDGSNLFLDFEAISAGENWRSRIDETLGKAQAALVVIGPRWLDLLKARAAAGGVDLVRSEIAACLGKPGVRVIPVIVNGARMPAPDALPDDIRGLADRNAIEVRGSAWATDVDRLVKTLRSAGALPTSRQRWILRFGLVLAAAALVAAVFVARVEVPSVPKDMSYKYAQALIESHGLRFQGRKVAQQGDDRGIDVVVDQRPAAGSTVFRGQTVEVDLVVKQPYVLVCRAGLSGTANRDVFKFEKYDAKPSAEMNKGSCSWLTDGPISPNQDPFIKPLGFEKELPKRFSNAPGGLLAFCAFSQYDHLSGNGSRSERLLALSADEYMRYDDNKILTPRLRDYLCIDHLQ